MGRDKIENGKKSKIVIDAAPIQEKPTIVIILYFNILKFNKCLVV